MNSIFHSISEWTVSTVHYVYRLLVYQMYFILSNSFFLILLLFIRFTLNNFLLFLGPFVLFLASLSAQFRLFTDSKHLMDRKDYFMYYREIFKNNWIFFVLCSLFISFIFFGFRILILYRQSVMLFPFVLTSCFLLSSMLFVLLISSDSRVTQIPFRKKMEWSLLVSYRLPLVTVYNIAFIGLTIFFMQHFSLAYICFFSGVINHGIYRNLTRRFSIDKFYEDWNG